MLEFQQQCQNALDSKSFQHQTSYTPFLQQPIEENFELEKSIEAMQEAERKFQEMLAPPNSIIVSRFILSPTSSK